MAFGGQVDYRPRPVLGERLTNQLEVIDIAANEDVTGIIFQRCKVFPVARIGELVQIDDLAAFVANPFQNEIGADKPGTSSDEDTVVHTILFAAGFR